MNKGRYRLVFSEEKGGYVPVPEETKACGKGGGARALRRVVAAMAAALPGLAIANPTGHQVVHGNVGVQVQGSTLNITASDKAIINWQQFSIQPGETTRFIQPSSTASVLNRVVGQDPSRILGNLIANGRVFLINPNGVLFGAGAKVDTAGLVASTLNIRNEDFLAGRMKFDAEGNAGKLRNDGTLKTTGGPLILIATDVENTGLITAENGDIVLAAGKSVEIADPHQPSLRVKIDAGGEAINLGQLISRGGSVGMFGAALTQAGRISATGAHRTEDGRIVLRGSKSVTLTAQSETSAQTADGTGGSIDISAPEVKVDAGALVDASGTAGGRIEVSAEQRATVEGTLRAVGRVDSSPAAGTPAPVAPTAPTPAVADDIDLPVTASGPASATPVGASPGQGGDIVVTAETVVLDGDAVLDASGDAGGGSILVGGDWQGANPEVRNARISWVGHGVSLLSDALLKGDGGKVVVWADEATAFAGSIWARGGREGGDGGQVEVSGKVALLYRGRTDTRAERGRNGELLLDPLAIILQGGSGDGSTDGSQLFRGGATPGTITADALGPTLLFESEIEEQSKTTDIILRAQRSVTVGSSAFSYTGSGNLAGEAAGTLVLADGSNLLIETRNLGGEEGGPSAGIDLVTGGLHGVNLRIVTQGTGSITMQTGYSNGTAVGDQRADIIVPVLTAGDGSILLRTVRGTGSTIQFRNAVTTEGVLQTSADMHVGSHRLQGSDGVAIDGDYTLDNGTLDIDGASAAISGTLYLSGTLDGSAPLTLGGLTWYSGVMTGTGAVTLTGAGELPPNFNYRYLDRTLNIAGTLDLKNNLQLYIRNGGTLHLTSTGVLQSTTHDGNIYFNSGASGTALFSADAGAQVNVAAGRQISLYSDNSIGNQISASFTTSGAGTLALTGGRFTLTGNSVITGSGNFAMAGADLFGSGNLTLGNNFRWLNGGMYGDGVTRITGQAQLPQAAGNRFIQRRLEVAGTLDANNNQWLYVQNGGVLHITSTGTLRSVTHDGNIFLQAGGSGSAAFSADQGARIDVGASRNLYLFTDSNAGNTFSADVDLTGAGTFAFSGGLITLSGDSSIGGTGLFAMTGANVGGAGNLDIDSRFVWTSGSMGGSGITRIGGLASLPQSNANKFLQRRLEVSGTLDADNNNLLYVQADGTLHLTSTGRLRSTTNDGNIYLQAGASGIARISADAGAEIDIAAGRSLNLSSDNNLGNQMSVDVDLTGTGTFALTSGNIALTGDSTIGGDGLLVLRGVDLGGSGNIEIDSRFVWTGGAMSGTGTTYITGDASMPQITANKILRRRLEVSGTFDADNNYWLYVQNGGALHLTSTATLRSTTHDGHFYFDAGASGVTLFSADAGATVDVADGLTMRLFSDNNLGNQFSARLNVTGAGALALTGGRFTLEGDSVIGGTGTFNLLNTDLLGSGNLTLRDNFNWLSGNMGGAGRTVLDTSITLSGTRIIDRELVIAEGRTLLLNDNGVLRGASSTAGGGRLTALGTLAKGEGSGNAYLQYLDISGNIQSRGGVLRLHGYSDGQGASIGGMVVSSLNGGGVLMESSTFNIAGQPLEIAADSTLQMSAGTIHLDGAPITGAGTFLVSGGTLLVNADSAITSRFTLSGGTLAGAADFTIGNTFDWSGGTMAGDGRTVLAAGTMASIGSASNYKFLHRRLDVAGTLTFSNSTNYDLYIRDGGTLHIASTGTLATSANGFIYLNESSNGTDNGSVVISADSGGRIAVADGTTLFLTADSAASNHLRGDFTLSGPGAVQFNSGLFNVDQATAFSGSGVLRLNGGTLATNATTQIANFEMTGGTLDGTATATLGQLLWQSGTMIGSGNTVLAGNGTINNASAYKYLHRRLEVAGTLTLGNSTNYDLYIRDGGTLHIASTGTLTTSSNGYIYFNESSNGTNNGIAALTSAAGGRIAVADGTTLFLTADGAASNLISGQFTLAGPGAVQLNSGLLTVDQASAFTGAGVLRVNGGTLFAGAATSIANLELTGGTLDGAGTFTLNQLDWRSGAMTGTGTTVLTGNGALTQLNTIKYLQRRLDVAGTLTMSNSTSSDLYIRDGGTLHLGATGTLATSGNAYLYMNEGFNNAGNGLAQLSSAAGGRIVVTEGNTLFISADGSSNNVIGGSFLFAGPGAVQQTGGTITADLATQINGAGLLRLSGGTFAATASTAIANLELSGGAIGGTADVTVGNRYIWNSGALTGSGVVTLAGTSTIASSNTYKDSSREIRITGNLTVADQNGYALRLNGARLAVASGGSLVLENDARITHTTTGRIDNAGLMVKRGPTALTLAMPLTNTGTLRIEEGTLTASAFPVNDGRITLLNNANLVTGNANLLNNGSIDGIGSIEVRTGTDASTLNNTLTNAGLLQPGGSGSAGVLSIQGNLVQTAAGSLEADLLGTSIGQQDRLQVSGSVALGGDLIITPAAGVTLGAQDRYTVLSCSTDGCLTGSFASIDTNGLTATATTFSNALSFATGTISSTWTSASSGFWDVAANWAGGLIPTAGNDVVIDQAGDLTVTVRTATSGPFTVNSLFSNENISVISGALTLTDDSVINGLLSVSDGTLNIGAQLDLNRLSLSGGTVTGGVLNLLGARSGITGGNLNNVAVAIGGAGLEVTGGIMNNVTLGKLASVTGNSLVTISNGGILEARGTLTLDGATIRLASTGNWTYLRGNTSAGLTTLNIAGNGTIDFAGSAIYNSFTAWHGNSTLNIGTGINLTGTQSADIFMGTGGTFSGTAIAAATGKTFEFSGSNWNNAGTLRAAGGIVSLTSSNNTTWASSGTLDLDSGSLNLGGTFNTASFNSLDRDGVAAGALSITGALNNTNATLLLDDSTGVVLLSGSITGGTIRANNPAGGALVMNGVGYLIDTTLAGVEGVDGSGLYVIDNGQSMEARGTFNALTSVWSNGLTLDGATIRLASTGNWTYLRGNTSAGLTTLNIAGNGTIDFAGSAIYNSFTAWHGNSTLNIGTGINLTGTQSADIFMGTGGTFSGTAIAAATGKTFEFSGSNWNNAGTLRAAGGIVSLTSSNNTTWASSGTLDLDSGSLNLGGTFNTASFNSLDRDGVAAGALSITGALNNTNATLLLDDSTGVVLLSGSITGGTIRANNPAGGALVMNGVGYLIDTTLAGVEGVDGSGLYVIDNGQSMEARGTFNALTSVWSNGLTLDGATIRLASTGNWTYLRGNTSAGLTTLNIAGNGTIDFAGSAIYNSFTAWHGNSTLNIGTGINLTGTQSADIFMGTGGTFSGTAIAAATGKTFEFSGSNWNNAGTLRAAGGIVSLTSSNNTTWASSGTLDLDSGSLNLGGTFNTASFNSLDRDGVAAGALSITGALNNTNATLLLDDSTGVVLLSGSITGGTIRANNPAGGALVMNGVGYLIDTTLAGVEGVDGSGLYVIDNGQSMEARGTFNALTSVWSNGLTLDGATIRLASTGNWTYLRGNTSAGLTTLNIAGNGTIDFAGSAIYNSFTAWHGNSTLNIGTGINLTGTQSADIFMGTGGTFSGTAIAAATGKTFEFSGANWNNAGTLRLEGGAITSTTSFTSSGVIRGFGSLSLGANTLTNNGVLRPDGLLTVTGNLVLGAAGTLEVGIAGSERGTQYDALDVTGTVTFGGTLRATHESGYTPGANTGFRLVRYNARIAGREFAALDVPAGFGYGSYYGAANYVLGNGSALTGINEWISNADGNWSVGSNWSLGAAPNSATQTVFIDRVGVTPTVTISTGTWTIGSLSSEESLTISGGSLTVNGPTRVGRTLTINGGRFEALGALDLNGVSVSAAASQFIANGGGTIADFDQGNGTSTFNAAGLAFAVLTPRGGTMNFNAAVTLPSSTLRVASYIANINADLGLATLDIDSGTVNLNVASSAASIDLSGGTLNVAGNTAMSGNLTWSSGTIAGGGVLSLAGVLDQSSNTTVYLRQTTLVHSNSSGNSRIANTSGSGFNLENGALLRNTGSLTLSVEAPNGILYIDQDTGPLGGRFENTGTLTKVGAGRADIGNFGAMTFMQGGTLNVEAGSLTLGNTVSLTGTQNISADAFLQVLGGTTTVAAGGLFNGAGTLAHSGGTLILGDGVRIASTFNLSGNSTLNIASGTRADIDGRFNWNGGTINGGGVLDANGVFDQSGNTTVRIDATTLQHHDTSGESRIANTSASGFNIENGGLFRNTGTLALIVEAPNGNLYIDHDTGAASRFENTGALTKRGAGNVDFGSFGNVSFDQLGGFVVSEGTASLNNAVLLAGTQQVSEGATLQVVGGTTTLAADGRIDGMGQFRLNSGTLALGDNTSINTRFAQSAGTLLIAPGIDALISNRYDWSAGTVSGGNTVANNVLVPGGTLTVSGELQLVGTSNVTLDNATLVHAHTGSGSRIGTNNGRSVLINNGAVFRNAAGALLTLDTPDSGNTLYIYQSGGTGSRFENFGSLVKSGVGTLDLGYNGNLIVQQSGTLLIDEGTLSNNAVSTFAGTQQIAADALLLLNSGTGTLAAGSTLSGDGRVQQGGGITTLGDGSSITADVLLSGGTLNVATGASVIVDGDLQWTGGTLGGAGTLTLNGVLTQVSANTVTLNATQLIHTNASGNSRIGNNNGRSVLLNNGALLQNAAGALLTLETGNNNNTLYLYQSTGTGSRFDNLGTLTKTGAGTLDLGYNGGLQFDQRGVLTVQQGLLSLNGVAVLSGAQQLAAGGTLDIRGATTTLAAAGSMTGAGNLSLSGGTLNLADGATIASTLIHSGGTLLGTGANTISGRYDWTAGTIDGSGTLTVSGPLQITGGNTQFLNARTLVHTNASGGSRIFKTSGAVSLNNGGILRNASGARLLFDSGNGNFNLNSSGGGSLVNEGTLTKVGGGSTSITSNVGFIQPGLVTIGQGSLSVAGAFTNAGTIELLTSTTFGNSSAATTNTGTVSGFGTLALGTQTFTNRGVVRPGGAGAIGTLNITGRYAQDATGTLQIERGNAGTDALIISSTATLGGTLVVSELPGYIATGGTSDVVTASALSGSFSTATLPSGYSTQVVGNRQVLSYAGAICGGVCWDGGAGSLLWTDAANWTGDLLPGTNDLVFIDLGTISVELNQGNHTIRSLNTAAGNTLVVSGGSLTVTDVAALAGDLVISGGTANFNGAAQLARLMLSSGVFGGSGTATFTQSGSSWTGGDVSGTGRLVLAAGSTLGYGAGTRTITRRLDIEQGGRLSLDSGSLTTTGGASNAGVVNVALGATGRYGGSATYLLDATGQFDGGGRIEFINSAQVTNSSTAPLIADNTFTVRVQDSARFTLSTPGAIANLELAGSGQVIAQAGLQAGTLLQTGGTLTLNAASGAGTYNWNGGTLAGPSTFSIAGGGSWTRGTLTGNLVIANGASLTLVGTGSDDVQSTSYKRFGAGSLTNFGTLNWLEGHIDVIGAGRVDNHGLIDLASDFSFGDRSTGTGTVTMVNHNSGVISKTAGTGEFAIGTLGVPGGTANYTDFTNNGRINVYSGRLRFNIGYSGAPGGGTFTHNNFIEIGSGSTLEIGGALTYNGDADLGAGGVLRRLGGFTINSGADVFGNGTIDVGTSGTLTNAGALGTLEYGTLSVTGNFVQTDTGILELWIGGSTADTYDQLAVSGSVTLGGTLVVTEDPAYVRGPLSLALITAGNGISGSFATIETPVASYTTAIDGNAFRISFGSIVCGGICWDGGAGTALWTDAANWSGDALPGLNDLVFIALDNGSSVMLNSGNHSIASLTTTAGNSLSISAGSLTLTGMSTLAGDLTLSGSGTLVTNGRLDATRFTQTGGTFNGAGDLFVSTAFGQTAGSHSGSGRTVLGSAVTFAPGSYTFNRDFEIDGALNHTSGTLAVAANRTVTINGAMNWTSGSTITGGTLNLAAGSTSTFNANTNGGHLTLSGVTLNNAGTVNYTSEGRQLLINDSTTFNNTGRFNFASDGVVTENSGNGGNFNNSGTLAKTGGVGSSGFASQVRFNNLNGGTVDSGVGASAGTINLQTQGAHAGVFNIVGNGVQFNAGAHSFANGATINGSTNFSGASISTAGATFNGPVNLTGGMITSTGTLTLNGGLNWSRQATISGGTLNLAAGSTSTFNANTNGGHLTLSGVTLNNAGTVNYLSDGRALLINDSTTFNNTGRFNFASDGVISETSGNGGNFNNSGTLAKTGGVGTSGFASLARLVDQGGSYRGETGTLQLASLGTLSGVMHIDAGATITTAPALTNTGVVEGSGTLDVAGGTLTNSGIVRPGGDDQIGRLTVLGNVTQTAAGRIEAEFAGTATNQFDVLDVRGNTLLDGVIEVQSLGAAVPVEGMQLPVVTASGALDAGALQLVAPTGFTTRTLGSSLSLGYTACTTGICWDGGAGSQLWTDAANWTGDVLPGVNDLVFITLAGGSNVVLNAIPTVTVAGLTIGNANSLTLTGGVLNAPTTVQPGGTLNLTGGNLNFGSALLNNGVLNYAGGTMSGNLFTNNGTLNVLSGSAGNLTTTRLNNNGSVIVDSGATFEFGNGGGMIFANNGAVDVESGTLSVLAHDTDASGPGADSGAYSVDSGATLRFRDAFRDFGPGSSITGPGDVEFTAFSGGVFSINGGYNVSGETRVSGNTLVNFNSNATFGDLRVAGNIGGNGALTVTDDLTWTSGSIGGTGRVIVVRGDTVLDGSSLALNGAVLNVGGSGLLDTGTQLALNGGSQLIVSDGASLGLGSNTSVGGTGSLVNRGTLEGTLGGGTSNVAVRLVNDGNVQASAGNLGLTGGIGGGGLFVIGDNATMELGGDLPPDIFNRIGGNGTLSFSPTSAPVINQTFAATGGTPLLFSLRSGAVLSSGPGNGVLDGQQSAWQYTANAGFNGNDSARFTLSLGSGTAQINVIFAVASAPAVTQPEVQVITTTLLPEIFQPPRIALPSTPAFTPPQTVNIASIDALSEIVTASGPSFEQPLREFSASRLQCR